MAKAANAHEGLIYAMVMMSAVDRQMSDAEMRRIGNIINQLPVFEDYDKAHLAGAAEVCAALLSKNDGLDQALKFIAGSLPKRLHETAYALAVEVAAAEIPVGKEEMRFLELLRDALKLDKLITAAIERGARARHEVL